MAVAALVLASASARSAPGAVSIESSRLSGHTERVSISSDGEQQEQWASTTEVSISASGRYTVFTSQAGDLVPGDTNSVGDVFVRDRLLQTTTRLSLRQDGGQQVGYCAGPVMSADGSAVAFQSFDPDLVEEPEDSDEDSGVLVRDLRAGRTLRADLSDSGEPGNGYSWLPVLNADGRYAVFTSSADNLVHGDTNAHYDVFVRDLRGHTTIRASLGSGGQEANASAYGTSVSGDGRYIVFSSRANNLVPGDTNSFSDLFLRDLERNTTQLLSVAANGGATNADSGMGLLSRNGRFLIFNSAASNLVPDDTNGVRDVFLRDLSTGTTSRIALDAGLLALGGPDGRYVLLWMQDGPVPPSSEVGDGDLYLLDRQSGKRTKVNGAFNGGEANSVTPYESGGVSDDGKIVVFSSLASNLVPDDTNGSWDAFIRVAPP